MVVEEGRRGWRIRSRIKVPGDLVAGIRARRPLAKLGGLGREMRTLAEVVDAILQGDLPTPPTCVSSASRAWASAREGGGAALASQCEIIPNRTIRLAGTAEQLYAGQLEMRRAKLSKIDDKSRKGEKAAG